MKRNNKILIGVISLFAVFAIQSCSEDNATIEIKSTFSTPKAVFPQNESKVNATNSVELKWEATGSTDNKWTLYFGEDDSDLPKIAENITAQSYTVTVEEGHTYYWYVKYVDPNNVITKSPTFSFTVKVNFSVDNFVGAYNCDEPSYGVYDVNLTKINSTTIESDNFWDSGWVVQYEFDDLGNVKIIESTIEVSSTKTWTVNGEGKYNNSDGSFYVDYVVVQKTYSLDVLTGKVNVVATTLDSNTHTFTRK